MLFQPHDCKNYIRESIAKLIALAPTGVAHNIEGGVQSQTEVNNREKNIQPCGSAINWDRKIQLKRSRR